MNRYKIWLLQGSILTTQIVEATDMANALQQFMYGHVVVKCVLYDAVDE